MSAEEDQIPNPTLEVEVAILNTREMKPNEGNSGGMTVRELTVVVSNCNPEIAVVCETRSEALLVIDTRPGMQEACPPEEPLLLTVADEDFLGALRIRHAR